MLQPQVVFSRISSCISSRVNLDTNATKILPKWLKLQPLCADLIWNQLICFCVNSAEPCWHLWLTENLISELSLGESIIGHEVASDLQWKHAAAIGPALQISLFKGGIENTFHQETNPILSTSLFCLFQVYLACFRCIPEASLPAKPFIERRK